MNEHSSPKVKPNPIWIILAGFFLTISVSFTTEITRRFLSGGADFLSTFSTLSQAILTLLAGSTFTQVGRDWLIRVFRSVGIERQFRDRWIAGLAFIVLSIVLTLRFSLPAIAIFYNNWGYRLQDQGLLASALANYQRAISLNPDYAEAHYNLARIYEEVLEYDKALGEYQLAIRSDDKFYFPYNNLARLFIVLRNDYAGALKLIEHTFDKSKEPQVQYSLYKNRGWAHFGLKNFTQAENDLRQALQLRNNGAAAHCLLAQVLEVQEKQKEAMDEWENCVRYVPGEPDKSGIEWVWFGLAKERLVKGNRQ